MQECMRIQTNRSIGQNNYAFLVEQNKRLKQQMEDMRQLIAMNKIQIDILSKAQNPNIGGNTAQNKKLIDLVYNYRNAYDQVRKKIAQLRTLIQRKSEENLLLEQINDQSVVEYKAAEEIYQQSIKSLQQNIADLEQKMIEYQKDRKQYDNVTGFVVKNKQIFQPTEQAISFKNNEIQWGCQIQILKQKLDELKKSEQNLIMTNTILRNKVVTLQAKLAMPNKNVGEILDKSLKRLMVYFIQTQKKILTGEQSNSQDQQDLELIAPEIHGLFPEKQFNKNNRNNVPIPHLDLVKIRQTMINGNLKIQQQLKKRNHLTQKQRLQRLQIQLQYTRRQLSKNIIQLRQEKDERKRLQRFIKQLTSRNELLSQSYYNLEKKLQKCIKQIHRNKQSLIQYIHNSTKDFEDGYSNNNSKNQVSFLNKDYNIEVTHNNYNNYNNSNNYKNNQKDVKFNKNKYIIEESDSKFQFKIYIEMLKRDLENNLKLQKMQTNKFQKIIPLGSNNNENKKLKRSTSNPFLYFNERRQNILDVNESKDQKDVQEGFRLQQTEYQVVNTGNFGRREQDLDDIQI